MSPIIERETLFYKQILSLLVVLAVVTVSGCLGLLWLRQKIEHTAQATRSLENQIDKEESRLYYINNKIAEIHQPVYLQSQIDRLDLDLGPALADQIIYLGGYAPIPRAYASSEEDSSPEKKRDPFRYSIDLAVMESLAPID